MATPESTVKRWTDNMLKGEKVWYFSPQAGPYGQAGIPDRIGIVTGLFFGIECKANAQCKMTALQERCKELIEAAGGKFFLVYDKATIEEVRQWIVSTRNRRQESGSSICVVHGRSCRCAGCLAVVEACERELADRPAQDRRDDCTEEPGVQRPLPHPIPIHVAWEI